MLADGTAPGISFRLSGRYGLKVTPDFRAKDIRLDGKVLLGARELELNVPVILRMGKTLLALCAVNDESGCDWARDYRFPLWTLFDPETLDAVETVRVPAEISGALARNALDAEDCLASPYGLPVCVPLSQIEDLLITESSSLRS